MSQYGHFTDDGLEYVITTPHTPRDWFNYLWNGTYLASASQNMDGNSLYQNADGVVTNLFGKQDQLDSPRNLYVRDNETGEIWSSGYRPSLIEPDAFECRNGLGYTIQTSSTNGVRLEFRLFVPRNDSGEIWTVRVKNESERERNLTLFTVANVLLDGVNMPYGYIGGLRAEYEKDKNWLYFQNTTHTVVDEKYRAFFYSTVRMNRWDTSLKTFLGKTRSYTTPETILKGKLTNTPASTEYLVAAAQHNLKLKPEAEKRFDFVFGVAFGTRDAGKMRKSFLDSQLIDKEFEAMKHANIQRVQGLQLKTPDSDFNQLFDVWMKHQLYLMADWARFYFKGYRDTCQDAAGMSVIDAPRAIEMLKKALINQRSDGFCPRAFRVASMDIAAADKHYADSPSWISHTTDTILCETGDLSILDQVVPYSDEGEATIWEHNLQAIDFLWNDRGARGLSLVHYGDWNDLMDKVGTKGIGEGIWMSFALARALKIVQKIAGWRGDKKVERSCARRYEILKKNILKHGWDGSHFLYSINDDGMPIGTNRSKEGKVFINPQSWAMLSGVIDAEEYTKIAQKIEPLVDTPAGPIHNWPAYTKYQTGIGQLSGTPPGFFTNGNVYSHAAAFKIAADFDAGRADKAFDTFKRILPDATKSEPYAQANGYVGPTAIRAVHHVSDDPWRTGTVAWNMINCVDRLLGFRRTIDGFHLTPLIPSKWKKAAYIRPFRGTEFEITITRGKDTGITVDGERIEGDFIPVPATGLKKATVHITCCLPKSS
jgi:cellobiose phosphorylase